MPEIQEIFDEYGAEYCRSHALSKEQGKVMRAISNCRTARLGGHIDVCPTCGYIRPSYNSCRNRHCPKCQALAKERWIENQKYDLLDVAYFHVVFTIPEELRSLFFCCDRVMYNLLFRAVAETLSQLASDQKYLGAKIGFTSVLHTWGQNLSFHPHIHCIVPAGGLTRVMQWRNSRKKFFLPVKVLSRKFRGKFLALLQQTPEFAGKLDQTIIDSCYRKEWVVYCKPPFKDAACVVEYLGRYTHRVAISNSRILSISDGKVTFKWRDYKDCSKWKIMTLSAAEFIRRFLLHVLPKGFMKIRHYGILGNRDKARRLKFCKLLTGTRIVEKLILSAEDLFRKICGHDPCLCPACGQGRIEFYMNLPPPVGF
ncbi:MAG: IS91 family transposase [Dehalococcoidia bacterium]|jgi:hypothetical protein